MKILTTLFLSILLSAAIFAETGEGESSVGTLDSRGTVGVEQDHTVTKYELLQNYPNPFNPATTISFTLPETAEVTLEVFDMLGRKVKTLVKGSKPSGRYNITFNAEGLPSGMYIYRLRAGTYTGSRTLMLLK